MQMQREMKHLVLAHGGCTSRCPFLEGGDLMPQVLQALRLLGNDGQHHALLLLENGEPLRLGRAFLAGRRQGLCLTLGVRALQLNVRRDGHVLRACAISGRRCGCEIDVAIGCVERR